MKFLHQVQLSAASQPSSKIADGQYFQKCCTAELWVNRRMSSWPIKIKMNSKPKSVKKYSVVVLMNFSLVVSQIWPNHVYLGA